MKACRFTTADGIARVGLLAADDTLIDLTPAGIRRLDTLLEDRDAPARIGALVRESLPRHPLTSVRLLPPVEEQEVWAAGVTYLRSKKARMEESEFSASAYDRVYDAARPEIFFKSVAAKVVTSGEPVGIRADARWNVPEPELALLIDSQGRVAGCAVGNDMSSRDIEGENLLYLPQAKVYDRSCALGPWVTLGATEADARGWGIAIEIRRAGRPVFAGETSVGQLKRSFDELAGYLFRSQRFPRGAVLLTGTGIVPPDSFTLEANDEVEIAISGIGRLVNRVQVV